MAPTPEVVTAEDMRVAGGQGRPGCDRGQTVGLEMFHRHPGMRAIKLQGKPPPPSLKDIGNAKVTQMT